MGDNLMSIKPGGDQIDISVASGGCSDSFSCNASNIDPMPMKSEKTLFNAEMFSNQQPNTILPQNSDIKEVYAKSKKK